MVFSRSLFRTSTTYCFGKSYADFGHFPSRVSLNPYVTSQNGQTLFKKLAKFFARFQSVYGHSGSLCIKGLRNLLPFTTASCHGHCTKVF